MPRLRAADRRRQLLEVAADLFARRGFRGTTTAELAKSAGVTEPILYRHFTSKLDLFVTLIEEVGDELIQAYQEGSVDVLHPTDRLQLLVAGFPTISQRQPDPYRFILQALTDASLEPKIAIAIGRFFDKLQSVLVEQISDLQETGIVRRDESAKTLASVIRIVSIGTALAAPLVGDDPDQSTRGSDTPRLLLKFLSGESSARQIAQVQGAASSATASPRS